MSSASVMTNFDRLLGHLLRIRRLERNLSQSDLAQRVGISFQQLQKYEQGKNRVSVSRLIRLCDALKIQPDEVMRALIYKEGSHNRENTSVDASASTLSLSKHEISLIQAFKRVSEDSTQKLVLDLVRVLAARR